MPVDGRSKVLGLVDALRDMEADYASKREAILDEIAAHAGGGESLATKLRELRAVIVSTWQARYSGVFVYSDLENVPHLKRFLVKQKMSKEDIGNRWRAYLASPDPFYAQRRHPFALFVRDINSFVGLPLVHDDDETATVTAEKMRERRGV